MFLRKLSFVSSCTLTAVECCRGSSDDAPKARRSRPNDYIEKQKNSTKTKDKKKDQKKKKGRDQEQVEVNNIQYDYGESTTDFNMHNYDDRYTDQQYNDQQFYPSDDIYTNDPQFQPPLV